MKNPKVCNSCGAENPSYQLTCISCKSYLRERIVNLDLWDLLGLMLHSPSEAFRLVINAEHKNFIFFILLFVSIKFTINSAFLFLYTHTIDPALNNFFLNALILFFALSVLLFLFSFAAKFIYFYGGWAVRMRDTFSVLTYSFVPHIYALAFLFVIELIVFGGIIFSRNPSPFLFKSTLAYTLAAFEALIVLWSVLLSFIGLTALLKNKLNAIISGLIFNLLIILLLIFSSTYLFN